MAITKETFINSLRTFKTAQDNFNEGKFVAQEEGKELITTAGLSKLAGIAEGAQVNVIESITIDGVAQTITGKGVALDLSDYVKGTDVASALQYKGTVANFAALPVSGQKVGDVYNITAAGGQGADGTTVRAGDNVCWNGTGWDVLAGTVDLSGYVEKVTGKGLSTEDYTTAEKTKLGGISEGAQVNIIETITLDGTPLTVTNKTIALTTETIADSEITALFS